MKKSILKVGNVLNKAQQRAINGGGGGSCPTFCSTREDCNPNPDGLTGCIYSCVVQIGMCVYDTTSCPQC
jgi:hypothetical protein